MGIDPQQITSIAINLLPGVIVFLLTVIAFQVVRAMLFTQLNRLPNKDLVANLQTKIAQFGWTTAIVTGVYLGANVVSSLSSEWRRGLYFVFIVVWGWQLVKLFLQVINYFVDRAIRGNNSNAAAYRFLGMMTKIGVWIILALFALSNLGYDVSSLIAGLGIGGIAIALAVQSILGDFISALSIITDKPFQVGDFIIANGHKGKVEVIGLRSTRVRSFDGETLIMPNSELVKSTIQNYGSITLRRATHMIGVLYETDRTLLHDIPIFIVDILKSTDKVEASTARANLISFGDSSINFEIAFEVAAPVYEEFLAIQEDVLYKIINKFAEEGISFAYPTRTVYSKD